MAKWPGSDIIWPEVACCDPARAAVMGCACLPMERALRGWSRGAEMAAMKPEQREFCLSEVTQIEGYTRADGEGLNDADLSRLVLAAWTDYCRDQGLL